MPTSRSSPSVLVAWIWLVIVFWALPAMCASGYDCTALSREQAMREPLLHFWAQTLLFFGRNARALRVMQEVVRENPARHEAWSVIGFLHAQSGELSQAIPAFEKALALQPDDAALAFNAAFVLQRSGDHERAMTLMQRAITLDPKLDRAWYGLGLSLAHVGRYEEAVTKFREAARLQPFNPYAGYQLGAVLAKLGRREELLAEYQRVKDFDPKVSGLMRREFGIEDPDAALTATRSAATHGCTCGSAPKTPR